ncbi:hypothetical protein [Bradyrhizobium symbiodeficiens]|uniref:hypothetical protein n=1 Tax=Bradyrhizobium symbiodeficiens TaxID=1404367 RepID=UPI00140FEE65|nr:hypothetical protein [Bradyrhizobium symbiodeficiens]QIP00807.1 hypothetical protein HAU86_13775 [Bradyrhizobium symbiodeficiens]
MRAGKYEMWSGAVDPAMVATMLASRTLQVRESRPMRDGKADTASFELDMTGLVSVWAQLGASCPPAAAGAKSPWPAVPPPRVNGFSATPESRVSP